MAGDAVGDIAPAAVLAGHFVLVVAGIAGVLGQRGGMTLPALAARVFVVDREGVSLAEFCRGPGRGGMAGGAVQSQQTFMIRRINVTGRAGIRRAFENSVDMAGCTFNRHVFAGQWEAGFGMVDAVNALNKIPAP